MNQNDGSRRPTIKDTYTTQITHPLFGKHRRTTEGKTLRASGIEDYCKISCFKNIREAILMSLINTIV